ncbi:bifunctional histidine phosphatase family protein/GNAT family N-acetyltransferase [Dysosmobacter sp.]|uniref:bifunctional histidine phosphatase family protein/GNAT family N-acetyltransferase n=2 Tax=Dysosmobacter sp. TaxID=2591382 RepID=UPI002D800E7D|nr:bifunctional histidine phosphatase family protein/GNAT family N-acetyltransferase [Dysosmobacter sp.]MCI6053992.1 bifunctional histidine phosphatase family protein/GNAT family N-acetyltransferase [Dysosmobacter sp.]
MTSIYLIRHAEAEGNLYRIAQGQYNSILTDRGWRQVAALARRFADIPVDAVYSSDLYRTCATASAIYKPKGLPLHRDPALREICVGVWEQKTWGEIARESPEQLEYFTHQLHLWHVEGAETPVQVRDRVLAAVRAIAAENDGKTVAVFCHGCAIRILLATLQGIPLEELGTTPHGDNTAVSLLQGDGEHLAVLWRDDNSHLRTPEFLAGEGGGAHANALEPGLYFEPLRLPEEQALLDRALAEAGAAPGGPAQPVLVGRRLSDGRGVGLVRFDPAREETDGRGWVDLLWIDADSRRRGYGTQLLGQAVAYYRHRSRSALRTAGPAELPFFRRRGFVPAGEPDILEKNIGYDPEFLSETAHTL